MPLHKNVLFSTTMKSEISNWCLFVKKWSHSASTCTMNKKCAMMFSWSSKILCQFILASSAPWSGGFFVVFFLSFCPQNFEKRQFFVIAPLKTFSSCVSCSAGPVHHPMSRCSWTNQQKNQKWKKLPLMLCDCQKWTVMHGVIFEVTHKLAKKTQLTSHPTKDTQLISLSKGNRPLDQMKMKN